MGKLKRSTSRFSAIKAASATKQQKAADHAGKENQAIALINQGELREVEAIYRELIASGATNHVVHGNLGTALQRQGSLMAAIASPKNSATQPQPSDSP